MTTKTFWSVKELKIWVLLLAVGGLLFLVSNAYATTIFQDDFETYFDGTTLAGNDSWTQTYGTSSIFIISFKPAVSGFNSVVMATTSTSTGSHVVQRIGTQISSGTIGFWFWGKCLGSGTANDVFFFGLNGVWLSSINNSIFLKIEPQNFTCYSSGGTFKIEDFNTFEIYAENLASSQWHSVQIEWQDVGYGKYRVSVDSGIFSEWYQITASSERFQYIDRVSIQRSLTGYAPVLFYLDLIQENIGETLPQLPYTACEGLSGFEWLFCEIENLIGGIFLPSTDKIVELENTITEVLTKAPFNYASSTKDFIDDIRTNTNTTSDISFAVLGQAGIVNFTFWDATTTIGGYTQKFSEILKTFLTFIVIMVFLVWLLSYIGRVF